MCGTVDQIFYNKVHDTLEIWDWKTNKKIQKENRFSNFKEPISHISQSELNFHNTFHLKQNYPNPFNPSTTIAFDLPKTSKVTLKVFNILGEELATLVSASLHSGFYEYEWEAADLASGVYLYRIEAEAFTETKKMILLK